MPPKTAAPPSPPAEPAYPHIEGFIEKASPDEVEAFLQNVEKELAALKGPKADAAKKAKAGVQNAQELLGYLLQVRERLAQERGAKGKK